MKYGILLALVTLVVMTLAVYLALRFAQKIVDSSKNTISEAQKRQNAFYQAVATIAVARSIFNEESTRLNLTASVKESYWQPVAQLIEDSSKALLRKDYFQADIRMANAHTEANKAVAILSAM